MRLFLLSILLVTGSCTVTKRIHRPGMSIQWHKGYTTQKSAEPSRNKTIEFNSPEDISESFDVEHSEKTEKKERLSSNELSKTNYAIVQEEKTTPLMDFQPIQLLKKTIKQAEQLKHKHRSIETKSTGNNTKEKPRSFYMGMGILSIILILALGITLLVTLGSPVLYYTAGIALLGIPLLFLFAIKNFKIARSIPIVRKVKIEKKAPELVKTSPSDKNTNNEPTGTKPSEQNTVTRPKNGAAISSFVFLLASLTLAIIPFLGIILFLISFILGITAIVRDQRSSVPLRYTALAWVAVGIATVIISIFMLILVFLIL